MVTKTTEASTGARAFGVVSLRFAIHLRAAKSDRAQFSTLGIYGVFTSGYAARNLAIALRIVAITST
jgi:hypothetical protein